VRVEMKKEHKRTTCRDLFYKKTDNDILYYILKPKKGSKEHPNPLKTKIQELSN